MATTVFFGTCQAQALWKIYNTLIIEDGAQPAHHISSNLPLDKAGIAALNDADIVVNQVFSFEQTASVPKDAIKARVIDFPYIAGWFLWPYASEPHVNQTYYPESGSRPYDTEIGDAFLNREIKQGTSTADAVDKYLTMDVASKARIGARADIISRQQEGREAGTEVRVSKFIRDNISRPDLFMTRGHPGLPLILHLCQQVFEHMGVARSAIERLQSTLIRVPDHIAEAAIHPTIARHFGMPESDPERLYAQFGGHYTFEQCCRRYMDYEWNQSLSEGIRFTDKGQIDRALQCLTEGLKAEPNSAVGHHALAMVLQRLERFDEAAHAFSEACRLDPGHPHYAIHHSNMLGRLSDADGAEAALRRALAIRPNFPDLNLALSHHLANHQRIVPAIDAATLGLKYSAKAGPILPHLGRLLMRNGDVASGLQAFERAVGTDSQNASLRLGLAQACQQDDRLPDALTHCRDAIRLEPSAARHRGVEGEILAKLQQFDDAIAAFQKAADLDPRHRGAHMALAHLLARRGDNAGAVTHGMAALDISPDDRPLLMHVADQLVKLGQHAEATSLYIDVLAIEPGVALAHFALSRTFVQRGLLAEALYAATNACRLEPENTEFAKHRNSLSTDRAANRYSLQVAA
jgi:superkiller protein 3